MFLPVDSPYRSRCDLPAEAAMRTEGSGCRCAARMEGVGCSADLGTRRQIGRGLLVPDGDWEGCCQPLCRKRVSGNNYRRWEAGPFRRPEHDPANVNWKQLDLLICLFAETTSRKDRSSLFHQQLVNQPLTALF